VERCLPLLWENLRGKDHLEDVGIGVTLILHWFLSIGMRRHGLDGSDSR